MNPDLRAMALERMKQLEMPQKSVPIAKQPSDSPQKISETKNKSAEQLPALFQYLDLDRDRLILLSVLAFLYFDHASPKILLAILYIML